MAERLLIVVEDMPLGESLRKLFVEEGYEPEIVKSAEAALESLNDRDCDLVIADVYLPGISGIELLNKVREITPETPVVLITSYPSLESAVAALRACAYDYVIKPIINEEIKQIVRNALRQPAFQPVRSAGPLRGEACTASNRIVGESQAMKTVLRRVAQIAAARSSVLLLGETGTGKELIARTIHCNSPRADKPFIAINCSAIPETLLESELFGHVRGAFTSAVSSKKGLLEEANGGTVLLDEIGDLSIMLQAKLLRVLEDQEIRPIGGVRSAKVSLRFIAATNRDIQLAVREGKFREDLFYRINIVTIKLPALRDRREDIEAVARYFMQRYSAELGRPIKDIEPLALAVMLRYHWPGNVRQLQNVIERAILLSEDEMIGLEELPEELIQEPNFVVRDSLDQGAFVHEAQDRKLSIEEYARTFVQKYNREYTEQQLADMLGITRKALWEKRKRWGILRTQDRDN